MRRLARWTAVGALLVVVVGLGVGLADVLQRLWRPPAAARLGVVVARVARLGSEVPTTAPPGAVRVAKRSLYCCCGSDGWPGVVLSCDQRGDPEAAVASWAPVLAASGWRRADPWTWQKPMGGWRAGLRVAAHASERDGSSVELRLTQDPPDQVCAEYQPGIVSALFDRVLTPVGDAVFRVVFDGEVPD